MKKHLIKGKSGFTLVELLIVVAVLGILVAIAIPNYLGFQKKAGRSEAKATLTGIAMALENHMAETGFYRTGATINDSHQFTGPDGVVSNTVFTNPGNIATIMKMGAPGQQIGMEYNYQIIINQPATAFTVIAIPRTGGRMAGDNLIPWIRSDGSKGPAGFDW